MSPKKDWTKTPKRTRIPFNPTMVRAILAKEKSETRRLKGLEEINKDPDLWHLDGIINGTASFTNSLHQRVVFVKLPYLEGRPLAVAEPIRMHKKFDEYTPAQVDHGVFTYPQKFGTFAELQIHYQSSGGPAPDWAGKLTPGMFMPVRLARIELPTLHVAVERLKEITYDEAIAEGAFFWAREKGIAFNIANPQDVFFQLWDSVNPSMPSKNNPWVFVVKFDNQPQEEQV